MYEHAGNGALGNLVALICDGEDDEDDGTIVFAGLATGDYVLIESAAPAGFAKTEAVTFAIVGEESEVIVVRHEPEAGSLTVSVADDRDPAQLVPEACFQIVATNEDGSPVLDQTVAEACDGSSDGATGTIEFDSLPDGDYVLIVEAPVGYLPVDPIPFSIADSASVELSVTIGVMADQLGALSLDAPSSVDEGAPILLTVQDTDASGGAPPAGVEFAFDCGDGDGVGTFSASNTTSCPTSDNTMRTVTAVARDEQGQTKEFAADVTVTNVAPTLSADDQSGEEGTAVSVDLGSFSDPGDDNPWSVGIDWGDGTQNETFEVTETGTLGTRDHTYGNNGTYTVAVSVTDKDGDSGSATFTVDVANLAPAVDEPVVSPSASVEGEAVMAQASFADPGAADHPFACTVDYGDGAGDVPGTIDGATCVGPAHAFADDGAYTVTISVTDADGAVGTASTAHQVADVPPAYTAPADQAAEEGAAQTFDLGTFTDPGPDGPWTVTVDWGDGSAPGTFVAAGAGPLSAEQTYGDNGSYTVTVSVADASGIASSPATFSVNVSNAAPAGVMTNSGPVNEGEPVSIAFSDLVDASAADTAAGLRYAFACDGSSLGGATYATAGVDAFTTCTYPDGPLTTAVRARVIDKDEGFTEYTTDVSVFNAVPVVDAGVDATINEGTPSSEPGGSPTRAPIAGRRPSITVMARHQRCWCSTATARSR